MVFKTINCYFISNTSCYREVWRRFQIQNHYCTIPLKENILNSGAVFILFSRKNHMKAMLHSFDKMCGCTCIFKIWAQWIDYKTIIIDKAFISYNFLELLFHFKSKYGCPISSKITKFYFISNYIIQLPRGLIIISNSLPLLNYPFLKILSWDIFNVRGLQIITKERSIDRLIKYSID